jgi:iron(III) transport system substrate-binding protein
VFRFPRSSRLPLMAGLAVIALAVTACSGGTSSTAPASSSSDAAGATGAAAPTSEITVYSGRSEELVGPLYAQFTAETGIGVAARYGDSAELAAQLIEEGDASPADVFFSQDAGALGALDAQGLLAQLPTGLTDSIPVSYKAPTGTWTGVTGRARVIAYDGQQLSEAEVPASVMELTDPIWKGQVGIAPTNASFQSFVTAMRVSIGDDATKAWLEGLIANDVQKYEKNGLILDAVDAGQIKLGLINHYYWYEKAAEVGADAMRAQVAFTDPKDPGTFVNVSGVGILAGAADNAGAQQFATWLLSKSAQEWFVANTFEYPLISGVAQVDGLPSLDSIEGPDVPLAELADLPGTIAMMQEVGLL